MWKKLENSLILVIFLMFQHEYGMDLGILKEIGAGDFVYLNMKKKVMRSTFSIFSTFSTLFGIYHHYVSQVLKQLILGPSENVENVEKVGNVENS